MLHCIAIANQNSFEVTVTYFELGISTITQPPPALGCKTLWKSRMSLPFHNFPPFSLDARGSVRISTPQVTRVFLKFSPVFRAVVLFPLPPRPQDVAQNFHCYPNNTSTTKIKTSKTRKSRSGISQKLHNTLVMTPWKKNVLLLVNHILPAS